MSTMVKRSCFGDAPHRGSGAARQLFRREDLDALLATVTTMPDQRVNDWVR